MKRFLALTGLLFMVGAIWFVLPGNTVEGQKAEEKIKKSEGKIPNRYIVVFEEWAAGALGEESNAEALATEFAQVYEGKIDRVFKYSLNGFSVEMSQKQAEMMSRDPRIKYIEEDSVVSIKEICLSITPIPTRPREAASTPISSIPEYAERMRSSEHGPSSGSTRSGMVRTRTTATATVRTLPGRSAARHTALQNRYAFTPSGFSIAQVRVRTAALSPVSIG